MSIKTLAKANYALDHGEIGLGSKLESQLAFNQRRFLPSELVLDVWPLAKKIAFIEEFAQQHDYPLILKSNLGCVGKGIVKVNSSDDVEIHASRLIGDYIVQKFTSNPFECGVFYTRKQELVTITGINIKHFPEVTGNGVDSIKTLALNHPRYTAHWDSFLSEHNLDEVLPSGEVKRLSFIGSHTLGCKFTDDTHLLTPEISKSIEELFADQPGFNFGRVDVKSTDQAAFQRGEFVVIEVNGVASLPTHMFDPKYSVWQAYRIFFAHARHLAEIAQEHRRKPMELLSYREVIRRVGESQRTLNEVHQKLMGR